MGHNSCTIAWKKDIPYNGKYISAFDKIVSSNGGDANRYEWRYNLKSWSLGIPDPCFPGKWFIPQGLVSAEWNSPVYSGILDPKTPVRDSGNGMYCWSGVRKAAYGTGAAVQFPCGDFSHNNPSSGKYPDWSWGRLSFQADGCASAGFEELCLIFPEAQRFIWHAGLPISAKAILAWLRSSNWNSISTRTPAVCSHSAIADAHWSRSSSGTGPDSGSSWNGWTGIPSIGRPHRMNCGKWLLKRSTGCAMDYPWIPAEPLKNATRRSWSDPVFCQFAKSRKFLDFTRIFLCSWRRFPIETGFFLW